MTQISSDTAREFTSLPAIERRGEEREQVFHEGKSVSHPILCELALMIGHSRRSDTRKKYAFKVCWWPLFPAVKYGQIVCKYKYERSEAGMVI